MFNTVGVEDLANLNQKRRSMIPPLRSERALRPRWSRPSTTAVPVEVSLLRPLPRPLQEFFEQALLLGCVIGCRIGRLCARLREINTAVLRRRFGRFAIDPLL